MTPGIYPNTLQSISFEEYRAHPGINSHYLIDMIQRSPLHAKWNKDHDEDTPAMLFGRAFHAAVLEPAELLNRFAVIPEDIDRRTKEGKAEYERLAASAKDLLKLADMHRITAMSAAIRAHSLARDLIGTATHTEASAFWRQNGLGCKARIDALTGSTLVDLKTTTDASRHAFERTIWSYGYHIQAAWYMAGARAAGCTIDRFAIVAVESQAPYGVQVFELDQGFIDAAEHQIEQAIETHRRCVASGNWSGYPSAASPVLCPAWLDAEVSA